VHPLADELVYVLSGAWMEDGVAHGPGSVLRAPRGVPHGPHHAPDGDVLSLTVFNGPLTVVPPAS
jgi:anti-sigma factor ChrR (cupin superfamily)